MKPSALVKVPIAFPAELTAPLNLCHAPAAFCADWAEAAPALCADWATLSCAFWAESAPELSATVFTLMMVSLSAMTAAVR